MAFVLGKSDTFVAIFNPWLWPWCSSLIVFDLLVRTVRYSPLTASEIRDPKSRFVPFFSEKHLFITFIRARIHMLSLCTISWNFLLWEEMEGCWSYRTFCCSWDFIITRNLLFIRLWNVKKLLLLDIDRNERFFSIILDKQTFLSFLFEGVILLLLSYIIFFYNSIKSF